MKNINLIVNIWRQETKTSKGSFVKYELSELNQHMSFLEMMDVLNEQLIIGNVGSYPESKPNS